MTIHLMQGESVKFKLTRGMNELRNAGSSLESGLQAKYVGIELEGKLMIIPSHNVRLIEIEPAPQALIAHVISDAQPVTD